MKEAFYKNRNFLKHSQPTQSTLSLLNGIKKSLVLNLSLSLSIEISHLKSGYFHIRTLEMRKIKQKKFSSLLNVYTQKKNVV